MLRIEIEFFKKIFDKSHSGFGLGLFDFNNDNPPAPRFRYNIQFLAFASSVGARRGMARQGTARPGAVQQPPAGAPVVAVPLAPRLQEQIGRFGCGTVIFLSSLLPLALAFALRVQADMQSGKTWDDIFPTMP